MTSPRGENQNTALTSTAMTTSTTQSLHLLFLFLLVASITASHGDGAREQKLLAGGWQPIKDLGDPQVQAVAKFAVKEHNKKVATTASKLVLVQILSGETQVVEGTNYRLVIKAKDGGAVPHSYEALVWEKPWEKFRKLTSFKLKA